MPVTTPPAIAGFTTPAPNRTDPANFSPRMDIYLGELQTNVTQMNSVSDWMETTANSTESAGAAAVASEAAAAVSANAAAVSAAAAASSANLTQYKGIYAPGTTYALGDTVANLGGYFWISNTSANIGNPLTPGTYWSKVDLSAIAVKTSGFTLDWAAEDILKFTATSDFTIVFINIPTSGVALVEIKTGGDHTVTYPAGVVFDQETEPLLAVDDKTTVLQFYTTTGSTKVFCKSLFAVIA